MSEKNEKAQEAMRQALRCESPSTCRRLWIRPHLRNPFSAALLIGAINKAVASCATD
jgi:hypothetical protein